MQDAHHQNTDPAAIVCGVPGSCGSLRAWWVLFLIASGLLFQASPVLAAAPAQFACQRLGAVLNALRTQGLTFIYNSELVPPQLAVRDEPKARAGLDLAREVLRPHGLTVAEVVRGVYTVVAATQPSSIAPAARTLCRHAPVHRSKRSWSTPAGTPSPLPASPTVS